MEDDKFDSDYATLERFFAKLQIALQENDVFGSGKSLLFSTDKWSWCFDASKKYTLHHWHKSEKSPIDCDTIITTNSSTLRALATGSLKPMHAYMSGRIKFSGDRGVLKMYAKAMKQAMVQDKKSADTKPAHTSAHYLDAHIVDTVIDKSRDKEVVKYVILVVNNHAQQSWKVQRRYSDFVKLQYALSKNSQPIRVIKSNNAMFVSKEKLVKERVGVLNEFLQHVTHNLPPHNIVVNSFLTNDQHSIYLWQQPQNEENSQEVPEHTAQEDIATHVFDHCLPYQSDNLARNTVILNEMAEMKQSLSQLKRLVFRDHASVIVSLLLVFRHLLCVYIAYCLLSVQLSNGDSDYFRVTWLQIKAHLYASSVVVYLLYTQSFSLLGAYLNMLCVPRVAHMIASMETELSVSRVCHTFFTSFVDSVHTIAATSLWKVSSLLFMHNTIDLCYILLCVIYVTVITFGICIYTKPRLQRGLEIYSMGLSLIFFYAFLSLVLYLLGYDEQQRTVVYNYVDQYVSSYITHQIKQYKSIFIKFAQYFGARSDVMSAVWSEKLSVLQDQCSESRGIYVKRCMQDMVRDMFGDVKVEDVFQDFDLNPVASASIAQVHFAVLNLRKLKELKCKNIGVDWDGHVKLLEDMCQKSHNNAEFSSHSKSSKDVVQYLLPVAVKVQHEDIDSIMIADMEAVLNLTILAARLDNRWQSMVKAMRNWQNNMASELDFIQEASNLKLMHDALLDSKLNCIIPQLIFPQSIQRKRVLVMSRIYGYKVTDKLAIAVHNIHKTSLVTQIAHCCAYQMLQKGVFNADPHPGNIFFCLTKMQVVPGLLDFGMTVRLSKETRLLYCELVLALFDGDMQAAASCLNRLGYATNQTHRAPERDAEFFEYLLRDAAKMSMNKADMASYNAMREKQKQEDISSKVREKGGRQIISIPEDFLYITRVIGNMYLNTKIHALNKDRVRSMLARKLTRGVQYDQQTIPKELQALLPNNSDFMKALDEAQQRFYPRYVELRNARLQNQAKLRAQVEAGKLDYREDTAWIRERRWKVAQIPPILQKRPVELTGPANDIGMMINAFNTGAIARKVVPNADAKMPLIKYMPDSEDSSVPTLKAELQGILNLKHALQGTLSFEKTVDGKMKKYSLGSEIAYPIFRVPGIHLNEATMVDRYYRPVPNHLLLTCLYMYHVAPLMKEKGWVPSLYQPKLQSYEEACLVNDLIAFTEKAFGVQEKSTRVTCLVETLSGALQAEEITYGLRDYLCGLNAGRWDYIFQWIQVLQNTVTPDRSKLSMQTPHMEAYMDHIRDVCERRGAVFMGGMSAFIPSAKLGEEVYEKVSQDKKHEQLHGAQGAWVAHPFMVEQVLRLFTVDKHLVTPLYSRNVKASELVTMDPELLSVKNRTKKGLEHNISVGIQYIAAWLSGRGAVALNNLMEDMATAEICRSQVWQWYKHRTTFTADDGTVTELTPELFEEIFSKVVKDLEKTNEVPYAKSQFLRAIDLFHDMVVSEKLDGFIADKAFADLNQQNRCPVPKRSLFNPVIFNQEDLVDLLPGSHNIGEGMVKTRTKYFRDLFSAPNFSGHPRQFWFAGTSNPLVGSATVLGGGGLVGSYLGGWDANAVNNVLNKRLPDTLNVWVNDAANGARAINNHLRRDMEIENLDYRVKNAKLTDEERKNTRLPFNWLAVPQLVDLEQGWRSVHHTRLAVDSALDNGINFVHIEDQGYHKRCGHLGDKELAPFDSYCQILRAANLAATLRLGQDQQHGNGMIFVARTDAYSAKRIEFSVNLSDPKHLDHPFVDFAKGPSADGKYYYLKQGLNSETGNSWGLDLAVTRMAEVVRLGLAEYVWMETPNADLHVAKVFIDGVNDKLAPHGTFAKMLYNHSPSFDWDLGFVKGAQPLGDAVISHIRSHVAPALRATVSVGITPAHYSAALENIRHFIRVNGDPVQRDFDFSDATIMDILLNTLDLLSTENDQAQTVHLIKELHKTFPGQNVHKSIELMSRKIDIIETTKNVYRAIADARLDLFGKASASVGVELPLTTLPDFHYEAFSAHRLAMGLVKHSMQAYVQQVQRPERMHFEAQKGTSQPYPFYKHQESTGTGVDAQFGKILGSSDTKALEESTEADDLRDRASLEATLKAKGSSTKTVLQDKTE